MAITLTLVFQDERTVDRRFTDTELQMVLGRQSPAELQISRLCDYILDRLVTESHVEPSRPQDRRALLQVVTRWHQGLTDHHARIHVTASRTGQPSSTSQPRTGHGAVRDALLAGASPLLLVYDDHVQAREQSQQLLRELNFVPYLWRRADGWEPEMPDSDDARTDMLARRPDVAVGQALQALENGHLPSRTAITYQDVVWDVLGENQVLATAIPSLWVKLRAQDGRLLLLMPTRQLPPSWTMLFQVFPFNTGSSRTPILDRLARDLTQRAREGKLRPIAGRESHRRAALVSLRQAPGAANAVLFLGEAGTGKSAIVEQLAIDLASTDMDPKLRNLRLMSLDMQSLIAGTAQRGDFEARVSQLIDEAEENPEIVLFIDEIHTLLEGGAVALEALKEPLARGSIRLLSASTPADWAKVEQYQPAFASRFNKIHVEPPTLPETIAAIKAHYEAIEQYHAGMVLTEENAEQIAKALKEYVPNASLPREAITLLYQLAASAEAQGLTRLSQEMIWQALSDRLGVPLGPVGEEERQTLLELEQVLRRRIIGQEEAITLICQAVIAHRLTRVHRRPTVLMLVGPSGTGKTSSIDLINSVLLKHGDPVIKYQMEQFYDRHTGATLLGAPPGYIGSDQGSQLVDQARKTPYRVVLLDEIEKAHPEVIKQLMNIMETGVHRDPRGVEADFRAWVFCATTNLLRDPEVLSRPRAELAMEVVKEFAKLGVPPEVVGRIESIVPFRPLTRDALNEIARLQLTNLQEEIARDFDALDVRWDARVVDVLVNVALGSPLGARAIQQQLAPLRNAWVAGSLDPKLAGRPIHIFVNRDGATLDVRRE